MMAISPTADGNAPLASRSATMTALTTTPPDPPRPSDAPTSDASDTSTAPGSATSSLPDGPAAAPAPFRYQPALDGWRGIGIAMVMAYHAGLRTVIPGAFLWIDGFFTVSAFLITTLLLDEWAASDANNDGSATPRLLDLPAFWGRRLRRLGPALLVTLVAMPAFAMIADRAQRAALPGDVLATLFYVANWRSILGGADYFTAFVNDSPLKHTWSLAIEEQFYLVFPILMLALVGLARRARWAPRATVHVLGVGAAIGTLASAAWMAWLYAGGAPVSRLYYGTDTRAQSLLVGVALAAWWNRQRRNHAERAAGTNTAPSDLTTARPHPIVLALGIVGFLSIAIGQFFVHEDSAGLYRGGFLLAAVIQAFVFRAALQASVLQRFLALRPLVWIGGLAYGLYLFHFPIVLWLDEARLGVSGAPLFAARIGLSFAVALPVHRFIETPIRLRRWPKPHTWSARLAWPAGVVAITAVAILAPTTPTQPSKSDLVALVSTTAARRPPPAATDSTVDGPGLPGSTGPEGTGRGTTTAAAAPTSTTIPKPPPRITIVGDSTGTRLSPGLDAWATATGAATWAGDGSRVGCPLGRGGEMHTAADATGPVNPACNWSNASTVGFDGSPRPAWADLVASWRPDVVVVSFGPWDVADRRINGDPTWRSPGDPVYDRWMVAEMGQAVETLTAQGARVVWLTQPPWEGATRHPPDRLYAPAGDPARMTRLNALVQEMAAGRSSVTVVDLASWIAGTGDDARLRPDGAHFEPETAVEVVTRFLADELLQAWARS